MKKYDNIVEEYHCDLCSTIIMYTDQWQLKQHFVHYHSEIRIKEKPEMAIKENPEMMVDDGETYENPISDAEDICYDF